MSVFCPSCGAPIPENARFCGRCGGEVGGAAAPERTRVASPSLLAQHPRPVTMVDAAGVGASANAAPAWSPMPSASGQREVLLLVLDTSGSMAEPFEGGTSKLDAAIRAGTNLVFNKAKIDPLDEVGLISFTDHASVDFPLAACCSSKNDIIRALRNLSAGGGTDLDAGLRAADASLPWGRADITPRIVMLTDGNGGHPIRTANSLKSRGAVLDIIGVGESPKGVDEKLLRAIASRVAGELRYRFIKDQAALVTRFTTLANKTQLGQ